MYTGITILDKIVKNNLNDTRFGSTRYLYLDHLIASKGQNGIINFDIPFSNYETSGHGATHPDIKTQIIEMNEIGVSPTIYSNRQSSNPIVVTNRSTHWYGVSQWSQNQSLGVSISSLNFDPVSMKAGITHTIYK